MTQLQRWYLDVLAKVVLSKYIQVIRNSLLLNKLC